jgi:hypothetical protein
LKSRKEEEGSRARRMRVGRRKRVRGGGKKGMMHVKVVCA